jgi:nicotinamide riboside kinase
MANQQDVANQNVTPIDSDWSADGCFEAQYGFKPDIAPFPKSANHRKPVDLWMIISSNAFLLDNTSRLYGKEGQRGSRHHIAPIVIRSRFGRLFLG